MGTRRQNIEYAYLPPLGMHHYRLPFYSSVREFGLVYCTIYTFNSALGRVQCEILTQSNRIDSTSKLFLVYPAKWQHSTYPVNAFRQKGHLACQTILCMTHKPYSHIKSLRTDLAAHSRSWSSQTANLFYRESSTCASWYFSISWRSVKEYTDGSFQPCSFIDDCSLHLLQCGLLSIISQERNVSYRETVPRLTAHSSRIFCVCVIARYATQLSSADDVISISNCQDSPFPFGLAPRRSQLYIRSQSPNRNAVCFPTLTQISDSCNLDEGLCEVVNSAYRRSVILRIDYNNRVRIALHTNFDSHGFSVSSGSREKIKTGTCNLERQVIFKSRLWWRHLYIKSCDSSIMSRLLW